MQIKNEKVILRDFIESDIEDRIHWELVETEWQLWDAPWEEDEEFDSEDFRKKLSKKLEKEKCDSEIRWCFEICINDNSEKHIGWCNAYRIDDDYKYTTEKGYCTIGIGIPDLSSRRKGYATYSWKLFITYFQENGIKDIYTQTWSGNKRVIGLMTKVGFEECSREVNFKLIDGEYYDSLTYKLNEVKFKEFCDLIENSNSTMG
jgi:RimJ/RimL family protein N-acetyltransferase